MQPLGQEVKVFPFERCPPKVEATCSNRVGCAILEQKTELQPAFCRDIRKLLSQALIHTQILFFSTKAGSHTGLGLTGCTQMVTAGAGRFNITSGPGCGTTVQVSVPVAGGDKQYVAPVRRVGSKAMSRRLAESRMPASADRHEWPCQECTGFFPPRFQPIEVISN